MAVRKLNREAIELYSVLTHSLLPFTDVWKNKSEGPITKLMLDKRTRVDQAYIYSGGSQLIMFEVVDSDWYGKEGDWIGHHIRAYVLDDAGQWSGRAGEAWIVECLSNDTMWPVNADT